MLPTTPESTATNNDRWLTTNQSWLELLLMGFVAAASPFVMPYLFGATPFDRWLQIFGIACASMAIIAAAIRAWSVDTWSARLFLRCLFLSLLAVVVAELVPRML